MPAVQVRDLPLNVYDMLKADAKSRGRSITQQMKHIVMQHYLSEDSGQGELRVISNNVPASSTAVTSELGALEDEQAIAKRAEKRRLLAQRIASRGYHLPDDRISAAQMVREMRDER